MSWLDYVSHQATILIASAGGFALLGFVVGRPVRWPRAGLLGDLTFFAGNGLFCQWAYLASLAVAAGLAVALGAGAATISSAPLWMQTIFVFLGVEFFVYWQHRLLHSRPLWSLHLVHHSSPALDWLSASRMHPIEVVFYFGSWPIFLALGFSPAAFGLVSSFRLFHNGFVHSDLPWNLGPLRYVITSPALHRWHHEIAPEAAGKNFASAFAFYDVLFGTFYCPPDRQPARFGVEEEVPEGYVSQMAFPIRRWMGDRGARLPVSDEEFR